MASPNSRKWRLVREVEERQALLVDVEERRMAIEQLALYEGSYDRIYDEAVAMSQELKTLKLALTRLRSELENGAE